MSPLHACSSARTYIILMHRRAAIIARIPFRRHLLTPKGRARAGGDGADLSNVAHHTAHIINANLWAWVRSY